MDISKGQCGEGGPFFFLFSDGWERSDLKATFQESLDC